MFSATQDATAALPVSTSEEYGVCRCHALDATGVTVPATRTAPLVTHANKTLKLSVAVFPDLAEILESERPLEAAGRRNP
jgi:hypothetical protein